MAARLPLASPAERDAGGYSGVGTASPVRANSLSPTARELQMGDRSEPTLNTASPLRKVAVASVMLFAVGLVAVVAGMSVSLQAARQPSRFQQIAEGQTCAEVGLEPIRNVTLCLEAAKDLGLDVDDVIKVPKELAAKSPGKFPQDCYGLTQTTPKYSQTLWLNLNPPRALLKPLEEGGEDIGTVALRSNSGTQREPLCVKKNSETHSMRRPASEDTSIADSFRGILWGTTTTTTTTGTTTSTTMTITGSSTTVTSTTETNTQTTTSTTETSTSSVTETTTTVTTTLTTTPHTLPTLFCYTVMQVNGYEFNNVRTMLGKNTSIFQCDDYIVFSDKQVTLTPAVPVPGHPDLQDRPGPNVETTVLMDDLSTKPKEGSLEGILNTQIFVKAWNFLDTDGRFRKHDWVVKIDPDAVFFPDRLRERLHAIAPASNNPNLYMINCQVSFGFFGALEVLSRSALDTYLRGQGNCKAGLDWTMMGEDLWMKKCMDFLDVDHATDYGLLTDGYCNEPPMPCVSGKVSFHAFKSAMQYMQCVDQALGTDAVPLPTLAVTKSTTPPVPTTTTVQSEEELMRELLGHQPIIPKVPTKQEYNDAVNEFLKSNQGQNLMRK